MKQKRKVVESFIKELPEGFVVQYCKTLRVSEYGYIIEVDRKFDSIQQLSPSQTPLYNQLKLKFDIDHETSIKGLVEIERLLRTLKPQELWHCQQMRKIMDIEKITLTEDQQTILQQAEFEAETGRAYILIIWNKFCTQILDQVHQKFEQNQLWIEKIKAVCISIADQEYTINSIKQSSWKLFEHYRFQNFKDNGDNYYYFFSNQYPLIVLINECGIIQLVVDEFTECVDEYINKMIFEGNDKVTQRQEKQDDKKELCITVKIRLQRFENTNETSSNCVKITKIQSHWKQNGSKEFKNSSKLELNYTIDITEKPKINDFFVNYWNQIPEHIKEIKSQTIKDEDGNTQKILEKYQEVFATLGVQLKQVQRNITEIRYQRRDEIRVSKERCLKFQANQLNRYLYTKGMNLMEELIQQSNFDPSSIIQNRCEQISRAIEQNLTFQRGFKFKPLQNYKNLFENRYTTIEHVQGQITILSYYNDIKNYTQLMKRNKEKWGNNVRLILLGQSKTTNVEEWRNSQQYLELYSEEGHQQEDWERQKLVIRDGDGYLVVIIDKFGYIRVVNDEFRIEEFVDELLNEELPYYSDQDYYTQNEVDEVIQYFYNPDTIDKLFMIKHTPYIVMEIYFEQQIIENQVSLRTPEFSISHGQDEYEIVDSILENLFKIIPQNKWHIKRNIQNDTNY